MTNPLNGASKPLILIIIVAALAGTLIHCNAASPSAVNPANSREIEILGKWTEYELGAVLERSAAISDPGARIDYISERLLGTPYGDATLIGDAQTEEALVVNLRAMDCFTYIDYVEALRLAATYEGFKHHLISVRYRTGEVSFQARNHFFTDWREFNSGRIQDVTAEIGGAKTVTATKTLNKKSDGSPFLPGIPPVDREISYIPSEAIDSPMLRRMKTGDYAGIYSAIDGLDVSHTGVIIKRGGRVLLRHASSKKAAGAVVEEDLVGYLRGKPGLVILRGR
ncbi:MAG: N-acetylmuramoyl-L-alanine amidase-like domain-containing protein [Deltaproteobacteria bacterium]